MTLAVQKGDAFQRDFELQAAWYMARAGEEIAQAYLDHLNATIRLLAASPQIGRARRYRHRELKGLRSFRVNPPFERHLIFYRTDSSTLYAVRVIDGARDLPRRLRQPPGAD